MKIDLRHKWIFLILLILISFACTRKKNTVGVPDSDIVPRECRITSEKLERFYSFEDSLSNANSTKLTVGSFQGIRTKSLLKFLHMPDTTSSVNNVELKLFIRHNDNFEEANLKIGVLNTFWVQNRATWSAATDSTEWSGEEFSLQDYDEITDIVIEIEEDTLSIQFPENSAIVENWIHNSDENFGFVLYTEIDETDEFIEFYSTETASFPILTFDFLDVEQDTMLSFTSSNNQASDITIYHRNEDAQLFENQLRLANMLPTSMYLKFDITPDMFINPNPAEIIFDDDETGIQTESDFSRMNILKAELVLTRKVENEYLLRGDLRSYLVVDERLDNDIPELPIQYFDDYILYGTFSKISEIDFHYKIDVTKIIQSLVSGTYDSMGSTLVYQNKGFIVKSVNPNFDLQYLDFYTDDAENELYRPYLKILYVPPFE